VLWERITPSLIQEPDRPDWRADSIVFEVRIFGDVGLAVGGQDGFPIQLLPEPAGGNARTPRFVTTGLLLYSSDVSGTEDLWYREVSSGVTRRLTASASAWAPAPRPGTPGLVYVEGAAPDSGRLVLLPDSAAAPLTPLHLTPSTLVAGEPDWNPAGNQVCFSAAGPNGTRQIWRLSLTDTLPIQLTVASAGVIDRSPRWSPDGTRILFASNRGGRWGVWTVSPMGEAQGLNVLAQDVASAEIRHPAWSPDGARVILSSDRSGDRALWRLSNLP
jgi:Tol biopolymer transport system component